MTLNLPGLLRYSTLREPTFGPEGLRVIAPVSCGCVHKLGRDDDLLSCSDNDVVNQLAVWSS